MKINITIPCYNEEKLLAKNMLLLFSFCQKNLTKDQWEIVIVNNNSTDKTAVIGKKLAEKIKEINYIFLPQKGKGRAIKAGWQAFPADIFIFMDADLATDLSALPRLIQEIKNKADLAIGSRFHPQSQTKRKLSRKIFSWGYSQLRKILLHSRLQDTPCGFKAINQKTWQTIVPLIQNQEWFFDSELVLLAEKKGFIIKEIPIKWEDLREKNDKSKIKVLPLIKEYSLNLWRLRKNMKKYDY